MKEKATTWLELAENDLEFARGILRGGQRPHYAVHYCHQAIEKLLKAIVQERSSEDPKRTHNFKTLCQQAKLKLPENIEAFLVRLSPHYLASRYPEDMKKFYALYTTAYAAKLLQETERSFAWLRGQLTSQP